MTNAGKLIRAIDTIGAIRVYLDGTQSVSNSTNTTIEFNRVSYDDFGFWDRSEFEIVIPDGMAGVYSIYTTVSFDSDSDPSRGHDIESSKGRLASNWLNASSIEDRLNSFAQDTFYPGDRIWAEAFQNSGSSLNIEGTVDGSPQTNMAVIRMHPLE